MQLTSWYDAIRVTVRVGGDPRLGIEPIRSAFVQLQGGEVDLDELVVDVEALSQADGGSGCGGGSSFKSSITRGHTSWGADGSVITVVLDVAMAIGEMAMWDGLKSLISKYGHAARDRSFRHDWTDEEMIDHARRAAVVLQPAWQSLDLKAVRIDRGTDPDTATVAFLVDGKTVETRLRMINGVAVVQHTSREL